MKTNLKSKSIYRNNQTIAEQRKTPAIQVQTGIRAGWVPGQYAREAIRDIRGSLPSSMWQPEIR